MPASARPSFRFRPALVACAALAVVLGAAGAPPALAQDGRPDRIRPVTDAELENPSPDEWLMWRRTLNGWGYSPLDQRQLFLPVAEAAIGPSRRHPRSV